MKKRFKWRVPTIDAACLAGAASLVMVLTVFRDRLPQVASGDDFLSVVFGDARSVLSLEFHRRADSYLHGGVEMDYACEEEHDHHVHEAPEPHALATHAPRSRTRLPDPWAWINRGIRPPQVDRHLTAEQTSEMMPWFWAAVRTDPHNVKAWTDAWYAAHNMMGDKAMATRILAEARAANPDNPELTFYAGRNVFEKGKGDMAEARRLFEEAKRLLLVRAKGESEALTEEDALTLRFIENYLHACTDGR